MVQFRMKIHLANGRGFIQDSALNTKLLTCLTKTLSASIYSVGQFETWQRILGQFEPTNFSNKSIDIVEVVFQSLI